MPSSKQHIIPVLQWSSTEIPEAASCIHLCPLGKTCRFWVWSQKSHSPDFLLSVEITWMQCCMTQIQTMMGFTSPSAHLFNSFSNAEISKKYRAKHCENVTFSLIWMPSLIQCQRNVSVRQATVQQSVRLLRTGLNVTLAVQKLKPCHGCLSSFTLEN